MLPREEEELQQFLEQTQAKIEKEGKAARENRAQKLPKEWAAEDYFHLMTDLTRIRSLGTEERSGKWIEKTDTPYARARRKELTEIQSSIEQLQLPQKPWRNPFFQQNIEFARDMLLDYGLYALKSTTVHEVFRQLKSMVMDDDIPIKLRSTLRALMHELSMSALPNYPKSEWLEQTWDGMRRRADALQEYEAVLKDVQALRKKNPRNKTAWRLSLKEANLLPEAASIIRSATWLSSDLSKMNDSPPHRG